MIGLIGMEACCGAHHLARRLVAMGHEARLMPGQYVRPYVKTNKHDLADAEGIAEAVQRPNMRFVPVKSEAQLDLQALHRLRQGLMGRRVAVINQLRAFLLERGHAIGRGPRELARRLPEVLDVAGLSPEMRLILDHLRRQWTVLDAQLEAIDTRLLAIARTDARCRQMMTIPGIGPIIATALIASIDGGQAFAKGRHLAAWLGLVPRQHSTGGRTQLLGISKRGNSYLRHLLVHAARSSKRIARTQETYLGQWLRGLEARAHHNKVTTALAAKLARWAWAVLTTKQDYRPAAA